MIWIAGLWLVLVLVGTWRMGNGSAAAAFSLTGLLVLTSAAFFTAALWVDGLFYLGFAALTSFVGWEILALKARAKSASPE